MDNDQDLYDGIEEEDDDVVSSVTEFNEDEEEEDEELNEEAAEERPYALPPLPPVPLPTHVRDHLTSDIYRYITELRKRVDSDMEREQAAKVLQGDTNVLLAIVQVLQESNLLRRTVVSGDGEVQVDGIPQPEMQKLPLPSGYNSWILE